MAVVGCGAIGTHIADLLARAGAGRLVLIDRDVVELHNLQRQTLFSEAMAKAGLPKAEAASGALAEVNSEVLLDPRAADLTAWNAASLLAGVNVIMDATDNLQTRYLLNDYAVKHGVPWVYAACIGWEARLMAVDPLRGPCLRCVFEESPDPGELPTCETAGVIGPAAGLVGAWAASLGLQLLVGDAVRTGLLMVDLRRLESRTVRVDRRADCPCCGQRRFAYLEGGRSEAVVSLCGQGAMQVAPGEGGSSLDLAAFAERLAGRVGALEAGRFRVRFDVAGPGDEALSISVFADGRAIVQGCTDAAVARTVYDRWVGS